MRYKTQPKSNPQEKPSKKKGKSKDADFNVFVREHDAIFRALADR